MKKHLPLVFILLISCYLRAYTISEGLPYFYDEDEAHHVNRTVNMAKNLDFNPNYFHKPSLHFYLRMPVVWVSYFWNKASGDINSIDEIRTYNKFGIADYAFTASHPGIVKWNRALSLLFSLSLIILTYFICLRTTGSDFCAVLSAIITAISPPLISYASVIGVDTLMSMMCLITVLFSLKFQKDKKLKDLYIALIFSGLACSSKYNALPVVFTPILTAYLNKSLNKKTFILCLLLPAISFFAASPYILVSLPLFISDLSYEVWHYSTAGHVGHSAEPGYEQLKFYFNWFYTSALGPIFSFFALIGFLITLLKAISKKGNSPYFVFLSFPVLYFLMMVFQKANFVRNMLVIIPFLSILSGVAIFRLFSNPKLKKQHAYLLILLVLLSACIKPLENYLSAKKSSLGRAESRNDFTRWAFSPENASVQTAIAGSLQAVPQIPLTLKNFSTFDDSKETAFNLWLDGFDRVAVNASKFPEFKNSKLLTLEKEFQGSPEDKRIIENPLIQIFSLSYNNIKTEDFENEINQCKECFLNCLKENKTYACTNTSKKNEKEYVWLKKRLMIIKLPGINDLFKNNETLNLNLELMSPWENELRIFPDTKSIKITAGANFKNYSFSISKNNLYQKDALILYSGLLLSPFKLGLSNDKRSLSIAVKSITIN